MSRTAEGARTVRAPLIAALGVGGALVLVCSLALDLVLLPHDDALGGDFSVFYAAGLALRQGHNPYDLNQLARIEGHLHTIGSPSHLLAANPFVNPPLVAWAMMLLTGLPHTLAYVVWLIAMTAALGVGMVIVGRLSGTRGPGWMYLLYALTPIPVICLFLGQQIPLLFLALAVALDLLRRDAATHAGIALSVCLIKPHLLLPVIFVLIASIGWARGWQLLCGLAGSTVVLSLLTYVLTGPALMGEWLGTLFGFGNKVDAVQPDLSSLAGVYLSVLGRPWSTLCAAALVVLWLVSACLLVRGARRAALQATDPGVLRLTVVALAGWLLATPYTHPADLVLLALGLPSLVGRRLERLAEPSVRLALGALLIPEADLLGFRLNFVLSFSLLVPLALLWALRPWSVDCPAAAATAG